MARKEINIFSVSFLDLLSGALAAVIILFVVIPKMTNEQVDAIETLDELNVQVDQLDSLLQLAQNSIPEELYEQIQAQMDQLNQTIEELNEQVRELDRQLSDCNDERAQLQQQLDETRQQLAEAQQQVADLTEQVAELTPQGVDNESGAGQALYGVNSEFSIVITWPDNLDVDLHIINKENGEEVYFDNLNSAWGSLLTDVTSRPEGEDIYELFFQRKIVPGTYDIYYRLYSDVSQSVTVNGYAVLFPFKSNEYKIDFPDKTITHAQDKVKIGTIQLTSNSFTFN